MFVALSNMIKGLCQSGEFDAAFSALDEFPEQNFRPNVRTFSTIMNGLLIIAVWMMHLCC